LSRGRLITLEGVDGSGKSTLAEGLLPKLKESGLPISLLREPGGVPLSERIRELVHDPEMTVGPRAEALLYAAARAQLVAQELAPRLARGEWVLLDRYVDSSLAYQGAGRGLGVEEIRELNRFATADLEADKTLLLRIDLETALSRVNNRTRGTDRLEREKSSFFSEIIEAYDRLAAAEPERITVIDATVAPSTLLDSAVSALSPFLSRSR
jgi:dTMP kinase